MRDASRDSGRSVSVPKQGGDDGLTEELKEELEPVLRNVSVRPDQKKQIVETIVSVIERREAFQGPIPHPDYLAGYESILPGAAHRIIAMAETEQAHRHNFEDRALRWSGGGDIFGQVSGFAVSVGFIAAAAYCGYIGQPVLGVSMVGAGAGGVIYTLVVRGKSAGGKQPSEEKKPVSKKSRQRR